MKISQLVNDSVCHSASKSGSESGSESVIRLFTYSASQVVSQSVGE